MKLRSQRNKASRAKKEENALEGAGIREHERLNCSFSYEAAGGLRWPLFFC